MLGTPDFIAPEQIADSQTADIRADIYSLGCTLYYLLSGRPPFQAAIDPRHPPGPPLDGGPAADTSCGRRFRPSWRPWWPR